MTEISGSSDCGNSPKNRFVQDVAIALETGLPVPEAFAGNVTWEKEDSPVVAGRELVVDAIGRVKPPVSLVVHHAISHGKAGAANGEVKFADGHIRRFSHFFEFTSAKANTVHTIRTYGA